MTERDPIEEALRGAAPDEPAELPALNLDVRAAAPAQVRARTGTGSAGHGQGRGTSLLVGAGIVVALIFGGLQMVGSTLPPASPGPSPTSRTGPTGSPVAESSSLATFHAAGLTFSYPASWRRWTSNQVSTMGSTIAIVGTVDLGHCGLLTTDINCAYAAPLVPGDIVVFIGTGASPGGSIEEPPGGFKEFVDGMPAVVTTSGPIAEIHTDETRSWQVGMPGVRDNWYTISGQLRGPGMDALRDQVDALVRSIRFDHRAPSLASDAATLDGLVKGGVDALDRNARENYHSRFYACFPRRVGSGEPASIEDGPGGPLAAPITVTCSVSIEATHLGLYSMTLSAAWDAGPGYAAGGYRERVDLDATGALGGSQTLTDSFFPVTRPAVTPAPATTPIALAPGSLVEVLYPGVMFFHDMNRNDSLSDLPFGERLWIVDGPTAAGGEDWYRVQWQPTPVYDGIPGWMPSTLDGHPVVEPAAPRCTATVRDVVDLVDLIPAERLMCFGSREIRLTPVTIQPAPGKTASATGSPAWLAEAAPMAMFGLAGPAGVDPPLLVRFAPGVAPPAESPWVVVTGHFDDPAASGCTRSWAAEAADSIAVETAGEQVLVCREQFVITSTAPASAP